MAGAKPANGGIATYSVAGARFGYSLLWVLPPTCLLLVPIMLSSQVINGILLPVIVFFMLRITNDKSVLGSYTNGRVFNILAWTGSVLVALLSLVMVVMTLLPA